MNKVAVLYICTGEYIVFWKDFFISYEKNFLNNSTKEYFVFTDSQNIYEEENPRVHKVWQKNLGWPNNTLKRFDIFLRVEEELKSFDFIFFMNANCKCVDKISEEEFLTDDKGLIVVKHPGYYNVSIEKYDYDRNAKSKAFIEKGKGLYYVCGGVNGGKAEAYLELVHVLQKWIQEDEENGIIAKWHDESHLNRYILDCDDYMILGPEYCYPENWKLPFKAKIVVREKSKWINVNKIKYSVKERIKKGLFEFIFIIKRKVS